MDRQSLLTYVAGVFDGEGCIMIVSVNSKKRTPAYTVRIHVANTEKELIEPFVELFGGKIGVYQGKGNRKIQYWWHIDARKALPFLKELQPYFKSPKKKKMCELAIEFQNQKKNVGRIPLRHEYVTTQHNYYLKAKEINKKGL